MAEYNGWTNYETWCVNLWISNEQSSQAYADEMALDAIKYEYENGDDEDSGENKKRSAVRSVADSLKDWIEEGAPEVKGLYADLLRAGLSEVNWHEIADHYVDDQWDVAMEDLGYSSDSSEEERRDEKRGLYSEHEDPCN